MDRLRDVKKANLMLWNAHHATALAAIAEKAATFGAGQGRVNVFRLAAWIEEWIFVSVGRIETEAA